MQLTEKRSFNFSLLVEFFYMSGFNDNLCRAMPTGCNRRLVLYMSNAQLSYLEDRISSVRQALDGPAAHREDHPMQGILSK